MDMGQRGIGGTGHDGAGGVARIALNPDLPDACKGQQIALLRADIPRQPRAIGVFWSIHKNPLAGMMHRRARTACAKAGFVAIVSARAFINSGPIGFGFVPMRQKAPAHWPGMALALAAKDGQDRLRRANILAVCGGAVIG